MEDMQNELITLYSMEYTVILLSEKNQDYKNSLSTALLTIPQKAQQRVHILIKI
jgi:hypothetical protein